MLCGTKEDLSKVLSIIEQDGPSRGLCVNHSKLLSFVAPEVGMLDNTPLLDIPVARDGFVLHGAPVGSPSFYCSHALTRVKNMKCVIILLTDLKDSQMEYILLRSCLSLPKFVFILHTLQEAAEVGASLSNWAW